MLQGEAIKLRDLLVYPLTPEESLVVSCDAAGAIGSLPGDVVNAPSEVVGYFTSLVALMELEAAGAKPIILVNTLCVNPQAGNEILRGVNRAAKLYPQMAITGSMEKNIPVQQTGVGIVAIGLAKEVDLFISPRSGDALLAVGQPLVGEEVLQTPHLAVDLQTVSRIRQMPGVSLMVPCGSGGVASELKYFPGFKPVPNLDFPMDKSAGPSTCVLVACRRESMGDIEKLKPVTLLGYLEGE